MEFLVKTLGLSLLGIVIIAFASLISGTIVWLIWPHIIPVVLPGLVAKGIIVGNLGWWKSVLLSWIIGTLFKSPSSSK